MPTIKKSPIVINSVRDLLEFTISFMPLDEHHRHLRLWSRGQGNDSWELLPGVYRKYGGNDFAPSEDERLKLESHLTQDFRALGAGILSGRESQAELYFIQQHYSMPTRLLDWNTNPLAALWFAVTSEAGQDGMIALMDVYQLLLHQGAKDKNNRPLEGIASSRAPYFESALKPIFEWGEVDLFPDFVIPVRPDYSVIRLSLQRGCFTYHVPGKPAMTNNEIAKLEMAIIPSGSKDNLRKELASLGIDNFSIYGDLDALSQKLRYSYGIR